MSETRILIAEDEPHLREILRLQLECEGYRVLEAADGREAVWAHPDLLPTAADLDDPLGFRADVVEPTTLTDEEFDRALNDLLDSEGE